MLLEVEINNYHPQYLVDKNNNVRKPFTFHIMLVFVQIKTAFRPQKEVFVLSVFLWKGGGKMKLQKRERRLSSVFYDCDKVAHQRA